MSQLWPFPPSLVNTIRDALPANGGFYQIQTFSAFLVNDRLWSKTESLATSA